MGYQWTPYHGISSLVLEPDELKKHVCFFKKWYKWTAGPNLNKFLQKIPETVWSWKGEGCGFKTCLQWCYHQRGGIRSWYFSVTMPHLVFLLTVCISGSFHSRFEVISLCLIFFWSSVHQKMRAVLFEVLLLCYFGNAHGSWWLTTVAQPAALWGSCWWWCLMQSWMPQGILHASCHVVVQPDVVCCEQLHAM